MTKHKVSRLRWLTDEQHTFATQSDLHMARALRRLLAYADSVRAESLAEARGCCLAASLDVATYAQELGFSPRLVMWVVNGDPQYRDHWAVSVQSKKVIDPTRIQIDGCRKVLHAMSDYPGNFEEPRLYPYLSVSPESVKTVKSGRRFSGRFMWTLRWRIFIFELALARQSGKIVHLSVAVSMLWHFSTRYPLHYVRRSMESRLQRLQ